MRGAKCRRQVLPVGRTIIVDPDLLQDRAGKPLPHQVHTDPQMVRLGQPIVPVAFGYRDLTALIIRLDRLRRDQTVCDVRWQRQPVVGIKRLVVLQVWRFGECIGPLPSVNVEPCVRAFAQATELGLETLPADGAPSSLSSKRQRARGT